MSEGLQATLAALNSLVAEIQAYISELPPSDRFLAPVIDWHHPNDYEQGNIQGLNKFLHHVQKEQAIIAALAASSSQPTEYTSNLISLEGVWAAFLKAPKPVTAIWQAIDKVPGLKNGNGSMKIDVVGDGGGEWIKVNTIKESRLLVEFREQDSYLNSDYESDCSSSSSTPPPLSNTLLNNARILARAAAEYPRLAGLGPPRLRYVLTRLEPDGHSDPRVTQTLDEMRRMGIQLEFGDSWQAPSPRQLKPVQPGTDVILDLSILIALCCDSTHYPLPKDEWELESRFRSLKLAEAPEAANGTSVIEGGEAGKGGKLVLGTYTNATRDLRDQLRCEARRPLVQEVMERLQDREVQFWVTREVRDRLPQLVDVIGGEKEQFRARAMFGEGDFWSGSRWEDRVGANLADFRVGVLDPTSDSDLDTAESGSRRAATPFDAAILQACRDMLAADSGSTTPPPVLPSKESKPKPKSKPSKNPARAKNGTRFSGAKFPSGHTLRTLQTGIERGMTVLTNNRGAVMKVLREQGVTEGIPYEFPAGSPSGSMGTEGAEGKGTEAEGSEEGDAESLRARIWIVNPSSLAEWRRIQVERANEELLAQTDATIERTL